MNPFQDGRCLCRMPGESCSFCYRGKGFHRFRNQQDRDKEAKLEQELREAGHDEANFKVPTPGNISVKTAETLAIRVS